VKVTVTIRTAVIDLKMERRNFLAGTGVMAMTALAGCSGDGTDDANDGGDGGGGDEGESGPLDAEPEELLPAANLFGDGWEKQDEGVGSVAPIELDGETAKASFSSSDGLQAVDVQVTVFESVDGAMSGYEDLYDSDSSDPSVEDADIASEAYLFDAFDTVNFRDANVIGILMHTSDSSTKTIEYAADWHDTWRN
jgi:hypothetical protein